MQDKMLGKELRDRARNAAREKEPEANVAFSVMLLVLAVICFGVYALLRFVYPDYEHRLMTFTLLVVLPVLFVIMGGLCLLVRGKGRLFKYIFFLLLAGLWLLLETRSGFQCKLLLPVLLVLSMRYYRRRLTVFTYFASLFVLAVSVFCNAFLYERTGFIDLNLINFGDPETVSFSGYLADEIIALEPYPVDLFKNGMALTFLPNAVFLSVIFVASLLFMRHNLKTIVKAENEASRDANLHAELADVRTKLVLSQVKPHFIYNALASIAAYCTENPEKAQSLTNDFSDYLRNCLDNLEEGTERSCPFDAELSHIRCYMSIEKCRFDDNLNVEYNITVNDFDIPTLCVQPIVENAVRHGIGRRRKGGTVTISTLETDDEYLVIVSDDGVGFDKTILKSDNRAHIGLVNIEKRLALIGGKLEIESVEDIGTTVTIRLPKKGESN